METHPHSLTVLDDNTFEEYLNTHNTILLFLYAPWCGQARRFIPDVLVPLATSLGDLGVPTAVVNAACSTKVKEKLSKTVPALLFISKKHAGHAFPLPMSGLPISRLLDLCHKLLEPKFITRIDNMTHAEELLPEITNPVVVGYFSPKSSANSKDYIAFTNAAIRLRPHIRFYETFNFEVAKAMGIKTIPSVKVYNCHWQSVTVSAPHLDNNMTRWINYHTRRLVQPLSEDTMRRVERTGHPYALVFVDVHSDSFNTVTQALEAVAPTFYDQLVYVYADSSLFHSLAHRLGVGEQALSIVFIDPATDRHHVTDEALGSTGDLVNELTYFSEMFLQNEIPAAVVTNAMVPPLKHPLMKNGSRIHVPTHSRHTTELTLTEFNAQLSDSKTDLLLLQYTHWCAFCKAVIPVFNRVASLYRNSSDIMFARLNSDYNRPTQPAYIADHVPRIVFASRYAKGIPATYHGPITAKDLSAWVKGHLADAETVWGVTGDGTVSREEGAVQGGGEVDETGAGSGLSPEDRAKLERRIEGIRDAYIQDKASDRKGTASGEAEN